MGMYCFYNGEKILTSKLYFKRQFWAWPGLSVRRLSWRCLSAVLSERTICHCSVPIMTTRPECFLGTQVYPKGRDSGWGARKVRGQPGQRINAGGKTAKQKEHWRPGAKAHISHSPTSWTRTLPSLWVCTSSLVEWGVRLHGIAQVSSSSKVMLSSFFISEFRKGNLTVGCREQIWAPGGLT